MKVTVETYQRFHYQRDPNSTCRSLFSSVHSVPPLLHTVKHQKTKKLLSQSAVQGVCGAPGFIRLEQDHSDSTQMSRTNQKQKHVKKSF